MNVLLIYLTNLFYRYNKKIALKICRNTRTNSFFEKTKFGYLDLLYRRIAKVGVIVATFHTGILPRNKLSE